MLLNSHIRDVLLVTRSVAGMIPAMPATVAWAEPPHLASYWLPTRLSMKSCVQRGVTVLRELGFQGAHFGKSGQVAFGSRGDAHVEVICAIAHWVVFVGASPSLDQIVSYRDELVKRF